MSKPSRKPNLETLTEEQQMCTVEQAAAVLGIGRTVAYELIRDKKLHAVHIGRSCRVSRAELGRFISRLEQEQHPPARTVKPMSRRRRPMPDQLGLFDLADLDDKPTHETTPPPSADL